MRCTWLFTVTAKRDLKKNEGIWWVVNLYFISQKVDRRICAWVECDSGESLFGWWCISTFPIESNAIARKRKTDSITFNASVIKWEKSLPNFRGDCAWENGRIFGRLEFSQKSWWEFKATLFLKYHFCNNIRHLWSSVTYKMGVRKKNTFSKYK